MINVIDLFSGCGGMSLGFQNAGFNIVAAYDNWTPAVSVYRDNFEHPIIMRDLIDTSVINEIQDHDADLIIGGPPCQDFSIAGKRNDSSVRANLTIKFAEIVEAIRPSCFVMENVYNIEKSHVLPKAISIFKRAGFGISKAILDASYLGVPQARKRFFLVGNLHAKDGFLDDLLHLRHSKSQLTVHEYLGDKLKTEFYYMHPRSYKRRAVFSIHEPSATIRGVNRPMPSNYKFHHGDKSKNILNIRALTTVERSWLQTFPDSFSFVGNKTALEQMIGNAVPIKMAEHVANSIRTYLSN